MGVVARHDYLTGAGLWRCFKDATYRFCLVIHFLLLIIFTWYVLFSDFVLCPIIIAVLWCFLREYFIRAFMCITMFLAVVSSSRGYFNFVL